MLTMFESYMTSLPVKEKEFEVPLTSRHVEGDDRVEMDIEELMTKRFEMAMGLKDIIVEQPTIIIDETIDETCDGGGYVNAGVISAKASASASIPSLLNRADLPEAFDLVNVLLSQMTIDDLITIIIKDSAL
ncbi:hypothetical protein QVD17_38130 [Tagetes erecta]|uniref:Uncharacterized protein n=1 Tax=Tagetes erecta TaxID=13708 RepID=A0AAD8JVG2_TARER|nr:hypothetical protein QVD17_38130 [Tagetes erecta]